MFRNLHHRIACYCRCSEGGIRHGLVNRLEHTSNAEIVLELDSDRLVRECFEEAVERNPKDRADARRPRGEIGPDESGAGV